MQLGGILLAVDLVFQLVWQQGSGAPWRRLPDGRDLDAQLQVTGIQGEAEQRMNSAEESVEKIAKAEAPLLRGDDLPVEEVGKALEDLEAAIATANTAVGGAKTFLAMKRLAAKRLGEVSRQSIGEVLTKLQERLDEVAKKLSDTKRGMASRRAATVRREAVGTPERVRKNVEDAEAATKELSSSVEMNAEDMKNACQKAGAAQIAAQSYLQAGMNLLLARQSDAKGAQSESASMTLAAEMSEHLEEIKKLQAGLDQQQSLLREQEHKFVAQQLLTVAKDTIEKVEAKLEETRANIEKTRALLKKTAVEVP